MQFIVDFRENKCLHSQSLYTFHTANAQVPAFDVSLALTRFSLLCSAFVLALSPAQEHVRV